MEGIEYVAFYIYAHIINAIIFRKISAIGSKQMVCEATLGYLFLICTKEINKRQKEKMINKKLESESENIKKYNEKKKNNKRNKKQ